MYEDDDDEDGMDMPCPCQKCGKWFDLNDGYGSKKWFPNTVICERCHNEEETEIEQDEEIQDLLTQIEDAEDTLKTCKERLRQMNYKTESTYIS